MIARGPRRCAARALVAAGALALALLPVFASPAAAGVGASAPIRRIAGVPCIGAGDLARLLDAVQYWRADVRKLVLRSGAHRITFTDDLPFVLLDDRTLRLEAPVRSLGGELQVPVGLLAQLPRDSSFARLTADLSAGRVRVTPAAGFIGAPRASGDAQLARLVIPAEHADGATLLGRSRAHLRVRIPGALLAGAWSAPGDSLGAGPLLRDARLSPGTDAAILEVVAAPEAQGFRLVREGGKVTLEIAREGAALERFAAESAVGARALRVVVIDPAHGGSDAGVRVEALEEKSLTLALARELADELGRRGVRALLTRTDDRDLTQPERAETANRARADVVLSLHFDAVPGSRARGATLFCPVATQAEADGGPRPGGIAPIPLLPWRDVATRRAADSRALADAIASALETHGLGPARVRERLPVALLGVDAPGLALECATLSSPDDRARVSTPEGLRALAMSIADGVIGWARP